LVSEHSYELFHELNDNFWALLLKKYVNFFNLFFTDSVDVRYGLVFLSISFFLLLSFLLLLILDLGLFLSDVFFILTNFRNEFFGFATGTSFSLIEFFETLFKVIKCFASALEVFGLELGHLEFISLGFVSLLNQEGNNVFNAFLGKIL